jgi:hypothetical protein
MDEALPNLGLPTCIVALNGGLKPRLTRCGKDGGDTVLQTRAHHTPERIGIGDGTLKERRVIELHILGQTVFLPVCDEAHR